jgi:type I restriction enzyme S subunit
MAFESSTYTVEELVTAGALERPMDGNHGELHPKSSDFVSDGIPFIMAADLVSGRVDLRRCQRISALQASTLRKGFAKPADVLLSHKATIGRTAIVGELPTDFIVLTPQVTYYRVLDHEKIDHRFLKYYFDSRIFQDLFEAWANSGSTRSYLGITAQLKLPVTLPPINVQRAVSTILGALDDKVEHNRRMNDTLEGLARAIFKSWFVDFDPVVAKAAGRQPVGVVGQDTTLFPDVFVDTEEGRIPQGWTFTKLGTLAEINARSIGKDYAFEEIEYVDISSVSVGELNDFMRVSLVSAPSRAQRLVRHGDTIWSCVRPNRKSYLLVQHPPANLVVSTGFAVLSSRYHHSSFIYLWVTTDEFVDYLTAHAEGSAYPAVRPDTFQNAAVVQPPTDVLNSFERNVGPLLEKRAKNGEHSKTLAALRDALLPKLMSGEIRLRQAETLIEEAVG